MDKLELAGVVKYDYDNFWKEVANLYEKGQASTVIAENNEDMLHYTELNLTRVERLDRTAKLTEENVEKTKSISNKINLLTITEGWCGDAAQILPIVNYIVKQNNHLSLDIIFRDDNPQIIDKFLTNGTRSIPVFVALDASNHVIGVWGPRPTPLVTYIAEQKAEIAKDPTATFDIKTVIQKWYIHDKTISTQNEFIDWLVKL